MSREGGVGFHVSKGKFKSYAGALQAYFNQYRGFNVPLTAQIFATGPLNSTQHLKPADAREIKKTVAPYVSLYIHASYTCHPWSEKKGVRHNSIEILRDDLEIGRQMGAKGVIAHFRDVRPEEIASVVRFIDVPADIVLYLEINSHASMPNCYSNPVWIGAVCEQLKSQNIGICIDTAHAWVTGVDLTTAEKVTAYFGSLNTHGKPILIHANDAVNARGSLKDAHCNLGTGQIWEQSSGYKALFALGYPMIFERQDETKGGDDTDIYLYTTWKATRT